MTDAASRLNADRVIAGVDHLIRRVMDMNGGAYVPIVRTLCDECGQPTFVALLPGAPPVPVEEELAHLVVSVNSLEEMTAAVLRFQDQHVEDRHGWGAFLAGDTPP